MTKKKTKKSPEKKKQKNPQPEIPETKNYIEIVTSSNLFKFAMIGLITLILFFSIYSYIQHKIYQDTLSQKLPLDTTYAFIEVKNSEFLDQTQRLKTHPNQEQISQLLNLEEDILNRTKITPLLKSALQKNISIHLKDNQQYQLFLYQLPESKAQDIKFPIQILKINSETNWHYAIQGNILAISNNRELSLSPFKENQKLFESPDFQDAFQNTPQHNIAWFGINHSLSNQLSQDSLFPNNNQTLLRPITQFLGFTVGYLNINTQGLLVGLYSNPLPNSGINLSPLRNLDRFNPSLHRHLPPLQEIDGLVSATDSFTIINHLLANNSSSQIQIQNIATQRNLNSDNLQTLKDLFSKEYILYKQSNSYTLLLPELKENQRQEILDLLSNLEAFHNPILNSYTLEDGTTARTQSASEPISRDLDQDEQIFSFRLSDINQTIQADFTQKNHTKITYSPNQTALQPQTNSIESEQEKPQRFLNLLPEASSHMYLSDQQTLEILQSQGLDLYPSNINSSTYFFDDGIQIILQLTW